MVEGVLVSEFFELEVGLYIGEGCYKNNILVFVLIFVMYDYCFE